MKIPQIHPDAIFMVGNLQNADLREAFKDFALKEEVLNSLELKTHNPFSMLLKADLQYITAPWFYNLQVSSLALCKRVVTLPGWEDCPTAKTLVEIAHIMKKPVVLYSILSRTTFK